MIKLLDLVIAWEIKETEKQIKYQKRGTIRKLRSWGTLGQKTICCVIFAIEKHNKKRDGERFYRVKGPDSMYGSHLDPESNKIKPSETKYIK